MNDKDYKKLFAAHKMDVSDEGFSERVARRLPARRNILSQVIMIFFVMLGLTLVFALQGFAPILEQVGSFVASVSLMQMPTAGAIVAYLGMLSLMGTIGVSVARV